MLFYVVVQKLRSNSRVLLACILDSCAISALRLLFCAMVYLANACCHLDGKLAYPGSENRMRFSAEAESKVSNIS